MEFKEYLKNKTQEVEQSETDDVLTIHLTEDVDFKYHKECFADFHDDFAILYDKTNGVNLCVRYDAVLFCQHITEDDYHKMMKKKIENIDPMEIIGRLLED